MKAAYQPRFSSLQGFLKWQPEDRYKYEWNKGKVEKTHNMKQLEFLILKILHRLFTQTKAYKQGHELIPEGDVLTSPDQLRRPDLAYYTNEQIIKAARGENQIPAFVIELVSPNDNQIQVAAKVQEYFEAGVSMVWLVMSSIKQVHVYQSLKKMEVCINDDVCSASPVLPDFSISVSELFKVPS
jgi:Uma2 family endonuclease